MSWLKSAEGLCFRKIKSTLSMDEWILDLPEQPPQRSQNSNLQSHFFLWNLSDYFFFVEYNEIS